MDRYGSLELKWSAGYKGTALHFISDEVMMYGCGNILSFIKTNGSHFKSIESHGSGVGAIAVCHMTLSFAYAEKTLNPKIFIAIYPFCVVKCLIEGGAALEYQDLAFSTDGTKLVSLSGVPDFKMTVWDCSGESGTEICSINVGEGRARISMNPLNWKQMALFGPSRLTLWNLEHCGTEKLLTPVEVELPEKMAEVGSATYPKVPPPTSNSSNNASSKDMQVPVSAGGLFVPPDMSNVVYKESYAEFIRPKELVEPKSLCWTPKQALFVGCAGGQLMMLDFELGSATLLVNPLPPAEEYRDDKESFSEDASSEASKTAHSLVKEGSMDCMILSRKGLFVAGTSGYLRCFDVNGTMKLVDEVAISQDVRQLSSSFSYTQLAVGTEDGSILTANLLNISSLKVVSNCLHTELVGVDVLCPGSEHCVTCRRDGNLQVWDMSNGEVVGLRNLNEECTSVTCPMSCKLAVVGTASGHLYMISVLKVHKPKVVEKRLMHDGPITAIKHDQSGRFMVSTSTEGPVFFYSCKPSRKFEVLGYLELPGKVLDVSLLPLIQDEKIQAAILTSYEGLTRISHFQVEAIRLERRDPELYADGTRKLSSQSLELSSLIVDQTSVVTLVPDSKAFSVLSESMQLAQFDLFNKNAPVTYIGHDLDSARVCLSFHQRWIASTASDGKLLLRLTGNPVPFIDCVPHHYTKGCQDVVFSRDSQSVITIGDTGTITCWKLEYTDYGQSRGMAAAELFTDVIQALNSKHSRENVVLKGMHKKDSSDGSDLEDSNIPDCDKTWLMLAKEKESRIEDEKYSEAKQQLKQEIDALQSKVLELISTNENLPDIERLGRQEFILDTEDYQRMLAEEESLINDVREEIELANLTSMFQRDFIKRNCWDKMMVKGRTIKAFQVRIEVNNYPLVSRSEATLKELERVKALRNIEIIDKNVRDEATSDLKQTLQPLRHDEFIDDEEDIKEKQAQVKEDEGKPDPCAFLGSHRDLYEGECELLIDQFQLHSQVYKKHQIILLENCIRDVKDFFNREFDEVLRQKANEISRIREKNVRIAKIISQLKLDECLVQPEMSVLEDPEKLLMVDNSEVLLEKYVSPEETKRLEEAAKTEQEKLLAAMGDNPRERALDMMMGGRLEANVEEDLFKDLSRPDFMSKDPAEMSEEEIRMTREFEKKEEAFLEEREKLKKALEAELRKLQASITQGMESFDERLQKLFQLKIRTQMVVHEEELKILYLLRSLIIEQEVAMKIQQFNDILQEKKVMKIQLGAIISEAKGKVDEVKEQYDILAAEDKEMERTFRKDFYDCEPFVDQLHKLFRKRPRGQKHKTAMESVVGDPKSQDLFGLRLSSMNILREGGENPMRELDQAMHMPEGLELPQWERFVAHRHRKVESEAKVKAMALELAEMHSFLQHRQNEESRVQQEIQDAFKEISKLQEDKVVFDLNLGIQLLLKQGQVEVDMDNFIPDFSESVLVHRSRIEDLNSQIKTLGEAKLSSMMECKDFKRGIRILEWEQNKMRLEEEELIDKAKDIQMMRVTRDLLQRLHERDLFRKDIREKETLENTIEFNKRTLKKLFREKCKALRAVSKQLKSKGSENRELDRKLRELQVSVAERYQIEKLADAAPSEANREQRMKEILIRKKLVDTIKSQDEEYSILKMEVERLRMKTFPALVQVD